MSTSGPEPDPADTGTPEVTGLGTAQLYAAGMSHACAGIASLAAQFAAGLGDQDVAGPALAAVARAQELTQAAGTAWAQAAAALDRQTAVKEAYASAPEAGGKAFVTGTPRPVGPAAPAPVDDAHLDAELDRVNAALREAGVEYPLGARGVEDLAIMLMGIREECGALSPDAIRALGDGPPEPPRLAAGADDVTRQRAELDRVDAALRWAGVQHPLGARGIAELASQLDDARENLDTGHGPA
jgi:hypothetical protein